MAKTVVIEDEDARFLVRLVSKSDRYGLNMCLTHNKDEPLIEFYDYDHDHDYDGDNRLGQFVSRYYLDTLATDEYSPAFSQTSRHGLCLHGGVPKWSVSGRGMNKVIRFIDEQIAIGEIHPSRWRSPGAPDNLRDWRAKTEDGYRFSADQGEAQP